MNVKNEAARLYAHLVQKDANAWRYMSITMRRALRGDPTSKALYTEVLACHARRHALGWGEATPAKLRAAETLAAQLAAGDQAAWQTADELVEKAQRGVPNAREAWSLVAMAQARREHLAAGAVVLSPARARELADLARLARLTVPEWQKLRTKGVVNINMGDHILRAVTAAREAQTAAAIKQVRAPAPVKTTTAQARQSLSMLKNVRV